jgi:hypothetical protein
MEEEIRLSIHLIKRDATLSCSVPLTLDPYFPRDNYTLRQENR